jgi:hypothetical protein
MKLTTLNLSIDSTSKPNVGSILAFRENHTHNTTIFLSLSHLQSYSTLKKGMLLAILVYKLSGLGRHFVIFHFSSVCVLSYFPAALILQVSLSRLLQIRADRSLSLSSLMAAGVKFG